ncbi:MAG: DAK2 domain-containing protein, partial [Halanaerobiaceae bacterium]
EWPRFSSSGSEDENRAVISVLQGDGLREIFFQLGINKVIDGGQSMNPSTNSFLEAINDLNQEEIIIFPNNSNVISAAKQAASMSDKEVIVVPTNSIAENISALMVNDPQKKLSELKKDMEAEIEQVKTLKFTEAVKNSSVNNMDIKKGDILGLCEDEIMIKGENLKNVVIDLLTKVRDQEDLITLYTGKNMDEGEVKEIIETIRAKCSIEEIEDYYGGQIMYPLIISLE